jgi:ribosome-binding factor A
MSGGRMRRVDEAVRAVLSDAITQDLKDPRVGFVTVTAVQTSPDLRYARVYVSVLGDDEERADSMVGLQSAGGYLQRRVASELRLKHTPSIEFAYDESVDRGMRIGEILSADEAGQGPDPDEQDEHAGPHPDAGPDAPQS